MVDDLDTADAFELDARMRRALALEQRAWAEVGALLAMVARNRLHLARGHASFEAWARERLGISPRKARALLRLERAGRACPALRAAYRDGRLSWVQAQALVPVLIEDASRPWRTAWIAHAARVSVRRLEEDVDRALALESFGVPDAIDPEGAADRQTGARATATAKAREAEDARFFFTAPRDVARLIRATICSVRRHLERQPSRAAARPVSDGDAMEAMLDHALAAWSNADGRLPREHRVFERDGWRCTVPGCSSYRNLHDHHVRFRSAGGSDALENRTTLCAWHHLRGVHAGMVRVTGRAPERLLFELGLRPGRPPLARFTSGDVKVSPC